MEVDVFSKQESFYGIAMIVFEVRLESPDVLIVRPSSGFPPFREIDERILALSHD